MEAFISIKKRIPEVDRIPGFNELYAKLVSKIQDLSDSKLRELYLKSLEYFSINPDFDEDEMDPGRVRKLIEAFIITKERIPEFDKMTDYSETEDFDYVPYSESEDESLEYDSDAEVSKDSDDDSSDVEDCTEVFISIKEIIPEVYKTPGFN